MSLEQNLDSWLKSCLEVTSPVLNGLPVCPYAREARMKKLIRINEVISPQNFFSEVEKEFEQEFNKEVVVVACKDYDQVPLELLAIKIKQWREKLYARDLWVMSDHPARKESSDGLSFNHGGLVLVFIQKLSSLIEKSQDLDSLGYYKNWPQEYYDKVVSLRHQYYQRYLETQK